MSTRKVDPYVYVMEWIWRHSTAKGVVQHVLLRIGRAMQWTPSGFETGPLPTLEIARDTGLADSTVREQLKALGALDGDLEIVKSRRRGETYRYRLRREQLLPLPDLQPSYHRRMAVVSSPYNSAESPPADGADTAVIRRSHCCDAAMAAPNGGGDAAAAAEPSPSFSEVRCTEVLCTQVLVPSTPTERPAGEADRATDVTNFLTWWRTTYPLYNHGAQTTDGDRALVAALLAHRTLFRLQEMAVVLWLVDASEESWIAEKTDRSLRVLRHKADWLDRRAAALPAWWHACAHGVKCSDARTCAAMEATG